MCSRYRTQGVHGSKKKARCRREGDDNLQRGVTPRQCRFVLFETVVPKVRKQNGVCIYTRLSPFFLRCARGQRVLRRDTKIMVRSLWYYLIAELDSGSETVFSLAPRVSPYFLSFRIYFSMYITLIANTTIVI